MSTPQERGRAFRVGALQGSADVLGVLILLYLLSVVLFR